jgi:hypothetical protein
MNDLKELYYRHFRTANYLLAAHSVGLVGCISALKDYNSTPQLKGIGIFVVLFGVGLLGAIGNYIALVLSQATAKNPDEASVNFLLRVHFGAVGIAVATLVVAIAIMIYRFASL